MNTTQPSSSFRALRALLTLTALLASVWFNVAGAQTVGPVATQNEQNAVATELLDVGAPIAVDRFEKFNRGSYKFNDTLDKYALAPASRGYAAVMPNPAEKCVSNFFYNLTVPYTAVNNVLQGKFKAAGQDICRFVINSTVGLGGCFDVASRMGIPRHKEDFGQTLGKWGVGSGPYVMLPLLGPSTVRDVLAKPVDFIADPIGYVKIIKLKNALRAVRIIDSRVQLTSAMALVDEVAIDRYAFVRDAWLQKREAEVRDEDEMGADDFTPSTISLGVQPNESEVEIYAPAISAQRVAEQAAVGDVEPNMVPADAPADALTEAVSVDDAALTLLLAA